MWKPEAEWPSIDRRSRGLTLLSGSELFRLRILPNPEANVGAELSVGLVVGFAASPEQPPVATLPQLAEVYPFLWQLIASVNRVFLNYVALDPPADVLEVAGLAEASLSHEHDGERVTYLPLGEAETIALAGGPRTYRSYSCPRCQALGYASVPGRIRLE